MFLMMSLYALTSILTFLNVLYLITGNLLVTKDCRLRIADFGLARERPTGHGAHPDDQIDGTHFYQFLFLSLCSIVLR